jgi:YD repeat-containing protein
MAHKLISLTVTLILLVSTQILAKTTSYQYDRLNRLTHVERDNGTVILYQYDTLGNRSSKVVTSNSNISANFSSNSTSGTAPLTVSFNDQSNGSITSWLWYFGDGNTSTEQNPVHTYTEQGNHTVTLTVENGSSETDTKIQTDYIEVQEGVEDTDGDGVLDDQDNCLFMHNPDQIDANGDGVGDVCGPQNIIIYEEDFEDSSLDETWNLTEGLYEISNSSLHMYQGFGDGHTNSWVGINEDDKFIYHFESDILVSSSSQQIVGLDIQWEEYQFALKYVPWQGFRAYGPGYPAGQDIGQPGSFDEWYNLSMTIQEGYVTFAVNGNKINLYHGTFAYPDSTTPSAARVHGHDGNPDVNYFVDNIKAFVSSESFLSVLSPKNQQKLFKGQDVIISWEGENVTGDIQIDLYKGGTAPENMLMQLAAATENDGKYIFNPTDILEDGNDYFIGISAENGTVWDFSDQPFAIVSLPQPYDTFDSGPMDKDKWRWRDLVRSVSDGKMNLNVQSCDGDDIWLKPNTEPTPFMKAKVLVDSSSYIPVNAWGMIRLAGQFYNDSRGPGSGQDYNEFEGEVRCEVKIYLTEDQKLKAEAAVWRFDEADGHGDNTTYFQETFDLPISFDTEYELSLEFTGSSVVFKCNGETLTYQLMGPAYPTFTNDRYFTCAIDIYDFNGDCGYMKTQIDDVYFDKTDLPYDTFNGDAMNSNNWLNGEYIRQIEDEKLRLKVERCNGRGNNTVSPTVTNEPGYIEAKITVNDGSVSQGKTGFARLASYFYNEKRGPGSGLDYNGYQDNVWSTVRIELDDTKILRAVAGVWRSDDSEEQSGTTLLYEYFNLPIEFGQEYTLSIKFVGSEIIFKCNNEIKLYNIQSSIYESFDKHYYLQTRVFNEDQQCGFIDTTYNDLLLTPIADADFDNDGVFDYKDSCPNTLEGATVDATGCSIVKGDINKDGNIDLEDSFLGLKIITFQQNSADSSADVDGDGKIGLNDAIYIIQQSQNGN